MITLRQLKYFEALRVSAILAGGGGVCGFATRPFHANPGAGGDPRRRLVERKRGHVELTVEGAEGAGSRPKSAERCR